MAMRSCCIVDDLSVGRSSPLWWTTVSNVDDSENKNGIEPKALLHLVALVEDHHHHHPMTVAALKKRVRLKIQIWEDRVGCTVVV